MRYIKKGFVTSLLLFFLCFLGAVIAGGINSSYAQAAAAKAKLNKSSITIPIGKPNKDTYWFDAKGEFVEATALSVSNKVKGATYSFTSGDKKIATISSKGGLITGVKKGTTTITCKQTYKKKVTVVGTCKVTVKETTLFDYKQNISLEPQLMNVDYFDGEEGFLVPLPYDLYYRNQAATFTVKSNSEDLIFEEASLSKEEKDFYGRVTDEPIYMCTAKKPGTYTLSVIETYKGKTRTVGKFTLIAHDAEISDEVVKLRVEGYISVFEPISFSRTDTYYYFVNASYDAVNNENNVVDITRSEYGRLVIQGLKPGKATIKVYEDSEKGRYLGEYTVEVLPKLETELDNTDQNNNTDNNDDAGTYEGEFN